MTAPMTAVEVVAVVTLVAAVRVAGVQQQQRQQELQHDGPMLVEQLEHGDDEDGVPQQSAREESGSGSGRVDGEDERGTRAGMRGDRGLAQRKICMHAGGFRG